MSRKKKTRGRRKTTRTSSKRRRHVPLAPTDSVSLPRDLWLEVGRVRATTVSVRTDIQPLLETLLQTGEKVNWYNNQRNEFATANAVREFNTKLAELVVQMSRLDNWATCRLSKAA
jgi:hypothetical protein